MEMFSALLGGVVYTDVQISQPAEWIPLLYVNYTSITQTGEKEEQE